ncbi:MAG: hypothetical protein M5U09_13575 [Gammaproteobacteria bacterium]|nr:hypothetical protein [Gammaproteobacteria bacterium]
MRHHATGIPLRPGSPLTAQDAAQSLAKSLSDLINGELLLAGFGGVTVTIAARLLAEDEAANGEVNQQAELTLTVAGATEFSWDFDLTPFDAMTGIRSWVGGRSILPTSGESSARADSSRRPCWTATGRCATSRTRPT